MSNNKRIRLNENIIKPVNKEANLCPICENVTLETDQAVLCDGQCYTWYHKQCLGMMQDHYEKITEQIVGYEEWICPFCDTFTSKEDSDSLRLNTRFITNSSAQNRTLDEIIQEELINSSVSIENDQNCTQTLKLAAELGSALMSENQQFKANNELLLAKVASLEAQLEVINDQNMKLMENQEKLKDLLQEANKLNESLSLKRDKDLKLYEDNDNERLKIINTLDTKIKFMEAQNYDLKSKCMTPDTLCSINEPIPLTENPIENIPKSSDYDSLRQGVISVNETISMIAARVVVLEQNVKSLTSKKVNTESKLTSACSRSPAVDTSHLAETVALPGFRNITPPLSAKFRMSGETIEEFFCRNIDEFIQHQKVKMNESDDEINISLEESAQSQEVQENEAEVKLNNSVTPQHLQRLHTNAQHDTEVIVSRSPNHHHSNFLENTQRKASKTKPHCSRVFLNTNRKIRT